MVFTKKLRGHSSKTPLYVFGDYVIAELKKKRLNVQDEIDVAGKIIVITGANSGIGESASHEFVKRKAKVFMVCRDMKKGEEVVTKIKFGYPDADLTLFHMDLSDLASVRKCASQIQTCCDHIDILVNNAGFYDPSRKLKFTKDGFESHMGVNCLAQFLFTMLLLEHVKKGAPSRIVFNASMAYQLAKLKLDDLMREKSGRSFGFRNLGPYANSKLAIMYLTHTLGKELAGTGVNTYALCPGHANTGFMRNDHSFFYVLAKPLKNLNSISSEEAAENILYCSLSKTCGSQTGLMYRCNHLWEGAMEKLIDEEFAESLWNKSQQLVGLC